MLSFTDLAKKKEEENKKFKKSSFKATPVKPSTKKTSAGGGGGGVSAATSAKIDTLAEDVEDLKNIDVGALSTQVNSLSSRTGVVETNITALDQATTQVSTQVGALSSTVETIDQEVDKKLENSDISQFLTQAQVRALILQLTGGVSNETVPNIRTGQPDSLLQYTPTWSDNFSDIDAETLFNRWHPDTIEAGQHPGNQGAEGLRWAADYRKPTETAFIKDNALHMRAVVEERPNPLRKPYVFRGETMNPQNYHIYLSFLSTWRRVYSPTLGRHVTDPSGPNRTWGPGSAFEVKVDLSNMRTQCCRMSLWLMPANENYTQAYTPDGTLGVELDLTEIDFLDGYENQYQAKVISGLSGNQTPSEDRDLRRVIPNIDMTTGEHTLTLVWAKNRIVWYVDGIEVQREEDPRRIPQTPHYFLITREANSGLKNQRVDGVTHNDIESYSDGTPEAPADPGLWARPVYQEIDRLHNDSAKILSFNSWSFVDDSVAGVGIGDDTSGISPTFTSPSPAPSVLAGSTYDFNWDLNGRVVSDTYLELGSKRGGNDLGSHRIYFPNTFVTHTWPVTYSGPINARLWFRANANAEWHWRDYGFTEGLQPYATGTDGKPSVTMSPGLRSTTPPTVGGLGWVSGDGWDGTYANSVDYSNGVVPQGYVEGFQPPAVGVVGEPAPNYEANGTATLGPVSTTDPIMYYQYPNITGELLWPDPNPPMDESIERFEVTVNGVVVYQGLLNGYFVDDLPVSSGNTCTVRRTKSDGSFGPALYLTFDMVEL